MRDVGVPAGGQAGVPASGQGGVPAGGQAGDGGVTPDGRSQVEPVAPTLSPSGPGAEPAFSVVIPAHDEQSVVGRCLDAFLPGLRPGEAEVVVVANGCSDATAEVARRRPGVRVLERAQPSKAAALSAGDGAVSAFPRVYLDADIVVGAQTLRRLAAALPGPLPRVAAPWAQFVLDGRPWPVRAFFRVYTRLPYVSDGLVGAGVYALSAAGRSRFAEFPALTADDLFVQRLFAPAERLVLPDATFRVETPRDLAGLLAVRTRTARGNAELARAGSVTAPPPGGAAVDTAASTRTTVAALARLVLGQPGLLPASLVYAGVTALARRRAGRARGAAWERDASTRQASS